MRNPQLLPLVAHELDLGNLDAGIKAVVGLRAIQTVYPEPEVPDVVPAGRHPVFKPEIGKGNTEQAPAGWFSIFYSRPGHQSWIEIREVGIELEAVSIIIILSLGIDSAQAVQVFRIGVAPLLDLAVAFGTIDVVIAAIINICVFRPFGFRIEKIIAVGVIGVSQPFRRHARAIVDTLIETLVNQPGDSY
ncbi:hypothetical protein ES703_74206 [subsurface metagenome]